MPDWASCLDQGDIWELGAHSYQAPDRPARGAPYLLPEHLFIVQGVIKYSSKQRRSCRWAGWGGLVLLGAPSPQDV